MRTTLDIADDVLFAAREVAQREKRSIGDVVSTLARRSLLDPQRAAGAGKRSAARTSTARKLADLGITPLPHRGVVITEALINRIRDEEGI